ncbi:PAS domain S-box protein [Nitrosophilus kaiyonis]|uniref:PAS domain S-box protein n=1 Tax=Nitrosophilus kaiyonis TaxID=2930200 RepID=UPI0024923C5E|nr:PAS domain S-box protein [Nitrosophilus kaiyonis]
MLKKYNIANLSLRYKIALTLIAILSILAYLNLTNLIKKQSKYAKIINISGRQRMLSQQIALFAIYYKTKNLKQKIELMEKSHNYLISLKNMPKSVEKIFFKKPVFLDKRVKKYIKEAKNFYKTRSGKSLSYILNHSQVLLKDLDKVVYEYQKESERQTSELVQKEQFILILTLFTLLIEALFIFRPAIKKIEEYMKKLINEKIFEEAIVNSSPVAIIAVDDEMKVNVFNKNAEKIFGFKKEEMIDNEDTLEKIIPENYYEAHLKGFKNFINNGVLKNNNVPLEFEGKRKNGEIFPIRVSFGTTNLNNKKIVIANIEDIKKEKEKDKILLQQSRIAALGEMIGNIAHQWRQPLNAIKIVASGIKMRKNAGILKIEDIEKDIEKIINYTDYLSQTIDDFRNFFKQEKRKEEFNVLDIVKRALSLVEASYKHNNIRAIFEYDKKIKYFYVGYPNELAQVFLNILNNAKDVLIEREIKEKIVKVSLLKTEERLIIEICDNGGGVKDNVIVKIFDPYFTTKHKAQGTGMGLYMSKQIIEKHFNGFLNVTNKEFIVDNEKFYGACFKIELILQKD